MAMAVELKPSLQTPTPLPGFKMYSFHLLKNQKSLAVISDIDWPERTSLTIRKIEMLTGIEARTKFLHVLGCSSKRLADLFCSFVGILLLLPFLLIVAILIKIDSAGPVLYTQPRVGMHGKRIYIYKFRTMVTNAEQALLDYLKTNAEARLEWDQTQKLRDDPRVTRVGKFLRKFSIDEIPQLFNVLLGDMSLVGPRPIMVTQVQLYGEGIEIYRDVRPGMTGLWQVSGRNRTTFQERAHFDVYYVSHWCAWLDIQILLRTVWVVLSQDGAY